MSRRGLLRRERGRPRVAASAVLRGWVYRCRGLTVFSQYNAAPLSVRGVLPVKRPSKLRGKASFTPSPLKNHSSLRPSPHKIRSVGQGRDVGVTRRRRCRRCRRCRRWCRRSGEGCVRPTRPARDRARRECCEFAGFVAVGYLLRILTTAEPCSRLLTAHSSDCRTNGELRPECAKSL